MFAKFFIERPIFASVIAIVTVLLGAISYLTLPVSQYPEITPPTVSVTTNYPGADAKVVAETVGSPIEQEVNGVEDMLYMSSKSSSDGQYDLTVTFEVGTDLDMANVLVQNRVNVAVPKLPEEVKRQGVKVEKKSTNILLIVSLTSPDGQYDDLFLSNFATLRVKDQLARIEGVGKADVFGAAEYSMRIWLDPDELKSRGLTTTDVLNAVSEQNVQVAAGRIGMPPQPPDQNFQYTVTTLGRLSDVEQFKNIIVKTGRDEAGQVVRLKDVARVELGGQDYERFAQQNGGPAGFVLIYLLPGANALATAEHVKASMGELGKTFPKGLEWSIPYDTTRFIEASISQVYHTLFEAGVLAIIVILMFLQDWRGTIVPALTIPVTIVGTFIAMLALGFSINLLTLFGLILAIGVVVDDAIIVVEGASKHIEEGMPAKPATTRTMVELSGAIIATTLVLVAVFLPTAALPGVTGQLYRQFALVIAFSVVLSSVNALTLAPAMSAILLRPPKKKKNLFFRGFNRVFDVSERGYVALVGWMVRRPATMMLFFVAVIAVTGWGFTRVPTGFLPEEDQGYAMVAIQLPPAASQARTREVVDKVNKIIADTDGIADWATLGSFSILDSVNLSNAATVFLVWKDWDERGAELSQDVILADLRKKFAAVQDAVIFTLIPPAIQGLGAAGGFEMVVQDRGDLGFTELQNTLHAMIAAGDGQSGLTGLGATFNADTPELFVDVDRTQAKTMGVPLSDVFGTLQTFLGSSYVNDFNKFGRTYQVRVQADYPFRLEVDDIKDLEVRNGKGEMVPLGALVDIERKLGAPIVTRYNLFPGASIYGSAAAGFSSGQALALMEQMAARELPAAMGYEWTGMSFQEKAVGNQAYFIFALAIVLVFLVLSAQYESWSAPAAVILAVPLALLGTLVALLIRQYDNNVYTQIGLVLLIALASKNAILIVEFARELRMGKGLSIVDSAVEAARLRFRPILMTSFAFILGVVPLLVASGAGAASQRAVGTTVFGGMLASTFLAVAFVPVFYVVMQRFSERGVEDKPAAGSMPDAGAEEPAE